MKIPPPNECLRLLVSHQVPEHIIVHSLRVSQAAQLIAGKLVARGKELNLELVIAAGILHDITKMDSIINNSNHAETGGLLLKRLGYPQVADVVRQHVQLDKETIAARLINEAVIVNYADKRVNHAQIVTLTERFQYLNARYGHTPKARQRLKEYWEQMKDWERLLFKDLELEPDDLLQLNNIEPMALKRR